MQVRAWASWAILVKVYRILDRFCLKLLLILVDHVQIACKWTLILARSIKPTLLISFYSPILLLYVSRLILVYFDCFWDGWRYVYKASIRNSLVCLVTVSWRAAHLFALLSCSTLLEVAAFFVALLGKETTLLDFNEPLEKTIIRILLCKSLYLSVFLIEPLRRMDAVVSNLVWFDFTMPSLFVGFCQTWALGLFPQI